MVLRVVFVCVSLHPTTSVDYYVCKSKGMCVRSVGNVCNSKVCYHPHPTHPPQPKDVCVCTVGNVCKSKVCYHPHPTQRYVCVYSGECMQVQGMLPSPPHPPTHPNPKVCVCVQLGMYASPRYVTIPTPHTHPPQPKDMCVCVRAVGNVCKSKVCYHPHPTHPPTPTPKVCVCTVGNVCKSKVCYHPHPTHPPQPKGMCVYSWECMQVQGMLPSPPHTHPPTPTQRYVCACSWECMQVQGMLPSPPHPPTPTQRYVCVCTDESPKTRCVYR